MGEFDGMPPLISSDKGEDDDAAVEAEAPTLACDRVSVDALCRLTQASEARAIEALERCGGDFDRAIFELWIREAMLHPRIYRTSIAIDGA